jgi:hypothetical protein
MKIIEYSLHRGIGGAIELVWTSKIKAEIKKIKGSRDRLTLEKTRYMQSLFAEKIKYCDIVISKP